MGVQYSRRHVSINRDASWRAVERGKDLIPLRSLDIPALITRYFHAASRRPPRRLAPTPRSVGIFRAYLDAARLLLDD